MYDQYKSSPFDNLKKFFFSKSVLSRLIIINIAVFILVNIIYLIFYLFQLELYVNDSNRITKVVSWFGVPSSIKWLLLKPWTIITYMFLQDDFIHLLFNMIVLYFGGRIFIQYLSNKQLLNTYLIGGIFGALFFIIAFNIFPVFSDHSEDAVALGSSASVLAILVAIATYIPEFTVNLIFFGRVKLKYIAIVLVIIDLFSISRGNPGGHIAHLGGALWGFLYIRRLKRGSDLTEYMPKIKWKKVLSYFYSDKSKSKFKHVHVNKKPVSDDEYNKVRAENQEQIDKILEKISKSGYDSLTKEEKALLFDASNKK